MLITVETHVTDEISDNEIQISGYNMIRCNSSNSRTGGVIVYIKANIRTRIIMVDEIGANTWVTIVEMEKKGKDNVIVCALYHSPGTSDSEFINILNDIGKYG